MWMGVLLDDEIPYTTLGLRWNDNLKNKEIWFNNKQNHPGITPGLCHIQGAYLSYDSSTMTFHHCND